MNNGEVIPTIIIDTREQHPYTFNPARAMQIRKALKTGDYSILGHEDKICIERKSLDDFVQSVTHGRKRFFKEIKRMSGMLWRSIVIEGTREDIKNGDYNSHANPKTILATIESIEDSWHIPVFLCKDRQGALATTEAILLDYWQFLKGE